MSQDDKYRRDIDGLRALAVLVVVLYHLGVPGWEGGFIGVDVFFVISGFVVTRALLPRMATGRFSFGDFYARRFWRLGPALLLLLAVVLGGNFWLLEGSERLQSAKSALASVSGGANFFFWLTTKGYDAPAAEQAPLLHMWSLAVEEQFYLLWPALLLLGRRYGFLRRPAFLLVALLGSIALSEYLARSEPSLAYYLLPARAMELGLGAALVRLVDWKLTPRTAALASVLGLVAILASACALNVQVHFPGFWALPACLGTALLIQAGATPQAVSRLLARPLPSAVGRVSYAWYLWHWPPIAWANYAGLALTPPLQLGIGLGSLGLAWLSYRYWESPTRRSPGLGFRRAVLAVLLLSVGLGTSQVLSSSVPLEEAEASPSGLPRDEVSQPTKALAEPPTGQRVIVDWTCLKAARNGAELDACSGARHQAGRRLLIWGDSHARVYSQAWLDGPSSPDWTLTTLSRVGCPPLLDVHRNDGSDAGRACRAKESKAIREFLARHSFDAILLAARFGIYETGWIRNGRLAKATHFLADAETDSKNAADSERVLLQHLAATVRELVHPGGPDILLALPTPVLPRAPRPSDEKKKRLSCSRQDYLDSRRSLERAARALPGLGLIDPLDALCDAEKCPAWSKAGLRYKDDNHLNAVGQAQLRPLLVAALAEL